MQHDLGGLFAAFVEVALQDVHDELHGGVVVVEEQHLVEAGLLGLWPSLGDDAGFALLVAPFSRTALACHRRRHAIRHISVSGPSPLEPAVPAALAAIETYPVGLVTAQH